MLALARKVAIDYGQNYVGSEHLLAGIIREKEGFAARVLEAHGLTMEWLIKECGWQSIADRIEERERAEYERLRAKFDPQRLSSGTDGARGSVGS
jgi:ATP-dependent Clp protease ATP-binding subunit ClpA